MSQKLEFENRATMSDLKLDGSDLIANGIPQRPHHPSRSMPAHFGGFSFESDSLPDFSEFEDGSDRVAESTKEQR